MQVVRGFHYGNGLCKYLVGFILPMALQIDGGFHYTGGFAIEIWVSFFSWLCRQLVGFIFFMAFCNFVTGFILPMAYAKAQWVSDMVWLCN